MTTRQLSLGLAVAGWLVLWGSAVTHAQDALDPLTVRLETLPRSTHNSTIRTDRVAGTNVVRVWIDANEDDMRLYSPAGAQLDADFQVSTLVRPGEPAGPVSLRFESHGPVDPGPGSRALVLRADARPLPARQREAAPARSGDLLFLLTEAELSFGDFLRLVTSTDAEGRVWDVPFELLPPQLELLRAWAHRVIETAGR